MRLDFEKWILNQNFPQEALNQFRESVICYKASAYRASLLMSYLGFQLVLKDRILSSHKPDNIQHEQTWEGIKKKLRKEEAWDEEVNECIKKSDDNKRIFVISEDLRIQAKYWKYRRNDCAHSKLNEIDASHVESFWLFLRSNLSKFVVGGSLESFLIRLDRHFDPNYTGRKVSNKPLIEDIPKTILEEDIEKLFIKLNEIFTKRFVLYPVFEIEPLEFWNDLIGLEGKIGSEVIEFIKRDNTLEMEILDLYPERIPFFYERNSPGVRNLWRSKIQNDFLDGIRMNIFISLLRNGLIEDDKEEALSYMVRNLKKTILKREWIGPLKEFGYFEKYKNIVFDKDMPLLDSFEWANNTYESIGDHLDHIALSNDVVSVIDFIFQSAHYPYKMQKALKNYFQQNYEKREEYIGVCSQIGIVPTINLGF